MNFCRLLHLAGENIHFDAIITTSELLTPDLRATLEHDLHARVYDHYGQAERVCTAASNSDQTYYFDPAYGRVELIPVDGYEAGEGRRAVSIMGTTFWNDAMPLVRYDTGDLAIVPAATDPGADRLAADPSGEPMSVGASPRPWTWASPRSPRT